MRDDLDEERLRRTAPHRTAPQAILRAAIPHCIAVRLDDSPDATWPTIADLTTTEGRIIPEWMAHEVVKRGMKDERWDVIEILYGTSALSDMPPPVDHATATAALGISPSRLRHHVRLGDVTPHFSGTKPLYAISDLQRSSSRCRRGRSTCPTCSASPPDAARIYLPRYAASRRCSGA